MDPTDVLQLAQAHPPVAFADGEMIISAGEPAAGLFVLASGSLQVRLGDRVISRVIEPGSLVGEIGLLLGTPANADVVAAGDTVVHRIDDAADLFIAHPEFGRHLAVVLARRLRQVTTFLGDIEQQFAGRSGMLGLVPTVLTELLSGSVGDVDPGSERELDSPY